MKAYVALTNGEPISEYKKTPIAGKISRYWTKQGVTIFFFRHNLSWPEDSPKCRGMEPASPGMTGCDYMGRNLYTVMDDGECVRIAGLHSDIPQTVLRSIDNLFGEVTDREGASA